MTTHYNIAFSPSANIQDICHQHEISTILHFTRIENLNSILDNGLLSRTELQKRNIHAIVNDNERFDGCMNAICLSVSFPNYRMFYKYRRSTPARWAVLAVDVRVLWETECAFCSTNAASNAIRHIPLAQRQQSTSLEQLFADYNDEFINVTRMNLSLPKCYPTNPQAEVLTFRPIPSNYIKAIYVKEREDEREIGNVIGSRRTDYPIFIKPFYFSPRNDYEYWQSNR